MKVMVVEPFGCSEGGEPMHTKILSNALADVGAEVSVLTFNGLLVDLGEKVRHVSFCSRVGIFAYPLRLLERLLGFRKVLELNSYIDTFLTFLLVSREVKKQKYDAIHVLDAHPFILSHLILASFLKNCNLILTLRLSSRYGLDQWSKRLRNSLKNQDYRLCRHLLAAKILESKFMAGMERLLYQRALKRNHLAFICESQQVQESYRDSFFYNKLTCVPIGTPKTERGLTQSQARQYLNLTQDDKILLSFGVNHRQKNLEILFQAVQNLPRDFKILHAGKIDHNLVRNDPEKLAEKYGWLENTIIEDRYIPEDEMPYYFLAADAIILSYTKDFLHASGVLTHAAGFSLPVIASDVGQLGEFVKTHKLGLTFITEDAKSLREAIISFLNLREEEKLAMKRNLEKFAATFSWEEVAKRHLNLYQGLSDK